MDLYKIKYDIRKPDIDQLTINKDSRFAIELELIQPKNYEVSLTDNVTGGDYPVLIIKKSDGSEDEYYYSDLTFDEMYDEQIHTYIWKIDKFNQDISCCVDLYVYYYNEETEEEKEYDQPSLCVCKVACKDSSVANDAITYNEYDAKTEIAIGKDSYTKNNGVAIGPDASGYGADSIVIGKSAYAQADNAVTIGKEARVSYPSPNSVAIGPESNIKNSEKSIAVGYTTSNDTSINSIAIGYESGNKNSIGSITIGTEASGTLSSKYSVVVGSNASATSGKSQIVIGDSAYISVSDISSANNIAIGTQSVIEDTENETLSNAIAIGYKNIISSGNDTIALGSNISASSSSTSIGKNINSRYECVSIGSNLNTVEQAVAIGGNITAHDYSIVIGRDIKAEDSVIAIGGNCNDVEPYTINIGYGNEIYDESITIGNEAHANSLGVAIGNYTKSYDEGAVVIGYEAQSENIAIGQEAKSLGGIAIGQHAVNNSYSGIQLGAGTLSANENCLIKIYDYPLLDNNGYIVLRSDNGSNYRLKVSNDGTLYTETI